MRTQIVLTAALLAAVPRAWAASSDLTPSQIFAADSPSVVVVIAYGEDGKAIAQGSGVVIAKDTVVSNCHVVEKASAESVLYQNKRFAATLRYADIDRDLCSFTVNGLGAPPVRMSSTAQVQVGDTAYAIGAPEGLALTLSGGLISSLRKIPGGTVLQMTTPISPGSSGGGLFDSEGRLIGITSYYIAKGEQLNFALPVDWIRQLPQRGKLASANARPSVPAVKAAPELTLQAGIRAWAAGDYTAALAVFIPWAEKGNAEAQYLLGGMYANGQGVRQDYAQAFVWTHKAAAQGYADAQNDLGLMYVNGQGIPQSYVQAVAWYRKAAAQGDAAAQTNLGVMHAKGQGVPQDYAEAAVWYRKAAAQGDAVAQNTLGMMYNNGLGVPQNYTQAVAWYSKAAAQGDAAAQFNLGTMYDDGQGVPQNYGQAVTWFRKAAAQGVADAQYNLGRMYNNGQGVTQDYGQAVAWYRKAAAQGEADAQNNLGTMYENGQGVPQDYAEAVAWFRKAAAQGEADAQYNLGQTYAYGQGVPQDYVAAYALFNLSASLDSSSGNLATANRSKLLDLMTPSQVTAGQALTREMQRIGVIKALDQYLNSGTPQPASGSSGNR